MVAKNTHRTVVAGKGAWQTAALLENERMPGRQDGEIRHRVSGSAWRVCSQLQNLGADVRPLCFVGDDAIGKRVSEVIADRFPNALVLPALTKTAESVVFDDIEIANHPKVSWSEMPLSVHNLVARAHTLVVAPDDPCNADYIESLLDLNCNSFLQLSASQVTHPSTTRLAVKAGCVVVNDRDLATWLGPGRPIIEMMQHVRRLGVRKLIVTSRDAACAQWDADFYSSPAFQVSQIKRIAGAGDRFLGAFLAMREEVGTEAALERGLAAAALFVEGASGYNSTAAIQRTCQERPRVARTFARNRLLESLEKVFGLFF